MASARVTRVRVVDPVRDSSGHHPVDGSSADPSPEEMQKQQTLRGAATPMPRQPSEKVDPGLLPRRISPAPLPPRPKLRRVAPVASAATAAGFGFCEKRPCERCAPERREVGKVRRHPGGNTAMQARADLGPSRRLSAVTHAKRR